MVRYTSHESAAIAAHTSQEKAACHRPTARMAWPTGAVGTTPGNSHSKSTWAASVSILGIWQDPWGLLGHRLAPCNGAPVMADMSTRIGTRATVHRHCRPHCARRPLPVSPHIIHGPNYHQRPQAASSTQYFALWRGYDSPLSLRIARQTGGWRDAKTVEICPTCGGMAAQAFRRQTRTRRGVLAGLSQSHPELTTPSERRKTPRATCMRDLRKDPAFAVGDGMIGLK